MGVDDVKPPLKRSVWESTNGSRLMTVSTLLKPGEYKVNKKEKDDGTIVLECTPVEED